MTSRRDILKDISNHQEQHLLATNSVSKSNSDLKVSFQKRIPLIAGRWFIDIKNKSRTPTSFLHFEGFDESNYVIWYLGETEVLSFLLASQKFVLVKFCQSADLPQTLQELKSNYRLNHTDICLEGCIQDVNNDLILLQSLIECPLKVNKMICCTEKEEKREEDWTSFIENESNTEKLNTMQEFPLNLNRLEVSFLIGYKGCRIEYLKQECEVDIKIMPISYKLTHAELQDPTRVAQDIRLYGNLQNLQKSLIMIEQFLRIAPLSSKTKIQRF